MPLFVVEMAHQQKLVIAENATRARMFMEKLGVVRDVREVHEAHYELEVKEKLFAEVK